MKGLITFDILEKTTISKTYSIEIDENYSYALIVPCNKNSKLNINKKEMLDQINESKNFFITDYNKKIVNDFLSNSDKYLNNAQFITFIGQQKYDEIALFLKNNPEFKNKKIILKENSLLDEKSIKEIKELFYDCPNIYIKSEVNYEPVLLNEMEQTINIVNEKVKEVLKFNYSPFEQLIYVYDLVTDRVYSKEDKNDDYSVSRSLTSVLKGDKIVCVGFSNYFNAIINKLGISSMTYKLESKEDKVAHQRNIVYLKDDKYNIDGIFCFDPTYDSKKENNEHLNSYRFFCKPLFKVHKYDKLNFKSDIEIIDDGFIQLFSIMKENNDFVRILKLENNINKISYLVDKESLIPFYEQKYTDTEVFERLNHYANLFIEEIDLDTFLNALRVVRKNEYLSDNDKYPFDMKTFSKISYNSDFILDKDLLLMCCMFDEYHVAGNEFTDYISKTNLEDEINELKMCKKLKKVK